MHRFGTPLALTLSLALPPLIATAAPAYPERAVTMVIPFTPGGGTDVLARHVGHELEKLLGQPVILDYKPGANGLLASQFVAQREADGYTILFGTSSTHAIAPLLSKDKSAMANAQRDFAAVGIVANSTLVLAVSAKSPIRSLADYLAAARIKPVNYGTFGTGSSPHLMGELLAARQKVQLLHVPYKGSAPAVTDLTGGHIDSVFLTVAAVSTQIASGDVRALAVTGEQRVPTVPDAPTFRESGVTGLEDGGWFGIFAPAKTPQPIRQKIGAAIAKVVADPATRKRLVELGLEPAGATGAGADAVWRRSVDSIDAILKSTSIQIQ